MLVVLTGRPPSAKSSARKRFAFGRLAQSAKRYNLEMLVITPKQWLEHRRLLSGRTCDKGTNEWVLVKKPAKNMVVYDAMYLNDLKEFQHDYVQAARSIRKARVPYFNPNLPPKDILFRYFEKNIQIRDVIPETIYNATPSRVFDLLSRKNTVWFKPVMGSGGRNILCITKLSTDKFQVSGPRFERSQSVGLDGVYSKSQLIPILKSAVKKRIFMVQEDVPLMTTKDGRRVDFRVTVQRGLGKQWAVTALTARTGKSGSVLTNFHAGGSIRSLTKQTVEDNQFLRSVGISPEWIRLAQRKAIGMAEAVSEKWKGVGMLGIDVGIASNGRIYIYDCNRRPGRDILTNDEVEVFMEAVAGFSKSLWDETYARNGRNLHV